MSPDSQTCVPPDVTFGTINPAGCKYPSMETYSFAYGRKNGEPSCWRCAGQQSFSYSTPVQAADGYHSCVVYQDGSTPNLGCLRTKLVTETTDKPSDQMCVMCDFYAGYFMYAPGLCKNPNPPQADNLEEKEVRFEGEEGL